MVVQPAQIITLVSAVGSDTWSQVLFASHVHSQYLPALIATKLEPARAVSRDTSLTLPPNANSAHPQPLSKAACCATHHPLANTALQATTSMVVFAVPAHLPSPGAPSAQVLTPALTVTLATSSVLPPMPASCVRPLFPAASSALTTPHVCSVRVDTTSIVHLALLVPSKVVRSVTVPILPTASPATLVIS